MDEERWLACTNPLEMLEFLPGKASERKLRLFAVACARRLWQLLTDERSRKAVEISEQYADGFANDKERKAAGLEGYHATADAERAARNVADEAIQAVRYATVNAASCAYHAGYCDDWGDVKTTSVAAVQARPKADSSGGQDAEGLAQCQMLRDIFGNPFRPFAISPTWLTWNDVTVVRLGQAAYEERILPAGILDNTRLLILADALEESGCDDKQILTHLRSGGAHYRGCWVIDLLLGKA